MKRQSNFVFLIFGLLSLIASIWLSDTLLPKFGLAISISSMFFAFSDFCFNLSDGSFNVVKIFRRALNNIEIDMKKDEEAYTKLLPHTACDEKFENPREKVEIYKVEISEIKDELSIIEKRGNRYVFIGNIAFSLGIASLLIILTCYSESVPIFAKIKGLETRISSLAFSIIMLGYWIQEISMQDLQSMSQKYASIGDEN